MKKFIFNFAGLSVFLLTSGGLISTYIVYKMLSSMPEGGCSGCGMILILVPIPYLHLEFVAVSTIFYVLMIKKFAEKLSPIRILVLIFTTAFLLLCYYSIWLAWEVFFFKF